MTAGTAPSVHSAVPPASQAPPGARQAPPLRARAVLQPTAPLNQGSLSASSRTSYSASVESFGNAQRALRKLSPGLLARMRLLDAQKENRVGANQVLIQDKVGRIPESQLKELESQYNNIAIKVEKRGRAWKGLVRGDAADEDAYELTPMEARPGTESDQSSIISTSDRLGPSDSDSSDVMNAAEADTQKYRLPDIGKLRLTSIDTKEENNDPAEQEERRPTPPPKDTPPIDEITNSRPLSGASSADGEHYFRPSHLSRANSIYSLSRVSFTNQLSQLTSIKLPQASSLASSISAIPTSTGAARALNDASQQIRRWIQKASEVLTGLDAEDDVEWAAAGGREGLGEVDAAITRFESLIEVYIMAIDDLQMREDIASLSTDDLRRGVEQMEEIMKDWERVKRTLQGVKEQVEIAMEWEELWNTVLGEIGAEIDALSRLVFEMEERRHRTVALDAAGAGGGTGFDIVELETIMEEAPGSSGKAHASNRFSLPPAYPTGSPLQSPNTENANAESSLLALFARMQPLRASLDFLPMRLSVFHSRGNPVFPSACEELEKRRDSLEDQWKKLEGDAEALRRELSEDRWVLVFRNAGRQALKMCESVARSMVKLQDAIDENGQHTNLPSTAKKIESYEAKKMHYGPAIERVLSIIDKGVKDRLTVNGEVLRLQSDMRQRWADLQAEIKEMDGLMEELNLNRSQQLRDSISTILTDRSVASSAVETPGSSPASSVIIMSRKNSDHGSTTPHGSGLSRSGSLGEASRLQSMSVNKRHSSMPVGHGGYSRPSGVPRMTSSDYTASGIPSPTGRANASTPKPSRVHRLSTNTTDRPRWNTSTITNDAIPGHQGYNPLSTSNPSLQQTPLPTARAASFGTPRSSAIPIPSPLSRSSAFWSPPPPISPQHHHAQGPLSPPVFPSIAARAMSSMAYTRPYTPLKSPTAAPRLRAQASTSQLPTTAASTARRQSGYFGTAGNAGAGVGGGVVEEEESPSNRPKASRPASAMAGGRRSSMLPQPKSRTSIGPRADSRAGGGRNSILGEERPRWRP